MKTRFLIMLFAIGLLATVAAEPVAAQQSTLDTVKARGTLIAGVKSDYPPFGYTDKDGNLVGFDIDLMQYMAKRLGVKLDLRPVTSANRIPLLQNGTIDLIAASLTITRERAEVVDFSEPYTVIGSRFLVRKNTHIASWKDLAGKTLAFTQGTPWGEKAKASEPSIKPLVFQDKPQAVLAVLNGKADAYIDDAAPLVMFAKEHPQELAAVGEPSDPAPMGIGVRPNDSKWRNYVNFTLIDMWEDGTYRALYKKHFDSEPDACFKIYPWKL
jgi:polar amino acid transport system substrate-binding protein